LAQSKDITCFDAAGGKWLQAGRIVLIFFRFFYVNPLLSGLVFADSDFAIVKTG
jgi:hypothetical protein